MKTSLEKEAEPSLSTDDESRRKASTVGENFARFAPHGAFANAPMIGREVSFQTSMTAKRRTRA
jgi:hypothetical protein